MNLLFTGGSGFLGNNIMDKLSTMYEVKTAGIDPKDDYFLDIAKEEIVLKEHFDIVLHAAGKAHTVPKNANECQNFFDINFLGTKKLCRSLEEVGVPQSFIFISSVAVYGCEWGTDIDETYPLNGNTPYALSKIQAEQYLQEWCKQHNVKLSILRPSLLAGSTAPGNLGSMVHGIKTGRYLSIRNGSARKSILMAKDVANLIPKLINKGGIYNVCDDLHPSFRELELTISNQLGKSLPLSIPYWLAKCLALIGDCMGDKAPINSAKLNKITRSLTFSNKKAKRELDWIPLNVLDNYKI